MRNKLTQTKMDLFNYDTTQFFTVESIFWTLYSIVAIIVIGYIIHDKREPVKALAWITVITFIPIAGLALYVMVGRNHRKKKIFNHKEIKDLEYLETLSQQQLKNINSLTEIKKDVISRHKDIITLLLNNSKALLTSKNRVSVLNNGKQTFSSIMEELREAKSSIHIEYYIFENDRIGSKIARILMKKAESGVEVRFIYDDVGSWGLSHSFISKLKKSGVKVGCFMPVVFPWFTSKINYRNHRKIVVIDGKVAFTGGLNIADRYLRRGRRLGKWRDTHLKIEGEAALMLQAVFITDWYFLHRKELLIQPKYFPEQSVEDGVAMQIASSGPDSDWASIMQAFFAAINRAKKHIYISSPYFLPNQAILTALKVAALSGIDVRIMIPSRSDSKIVYWATRSYIGELVRAGIKMYLYNAGFNHSKLIMIDGEFSSVGSANMDIRSFEDNFEVSALIYDTEITRQLEVSFIKDLTFSTLATKEWWESRAKHHAIYESLSRLLSPLL